MNAYLRVAEEKDVDLLFCWANDSEVRKNAFSTETISYEEHLAWYQKLVNSPDCRQYIYIYNHTAVGQIRLTICGEEAEIDYSICKEKRGMGHGKRMLQFLCCQVKKEFPDIKRLTAKVKHDNVASQQAFLAAGYREKYSLFELDMEHATLPECSDYEENLGGVLFLTNNRNAIKLYDWLTERCLTHIYSCRLEVETLKALAPNLIISYNFNYLINREIIEYMKGKIINLHISYLPWNRGFSPNIWSFIENTPKGVTIHQVNEGLDTGRILFQKEICFVPEEETFISTYERLNEEIVQLFQNNWKRIRDGKYRLYEQNGQGSYHSMKDLETLKSRICFEWSDNIAEFLNKYKTMEN